MDEQSFADFLKVHLVSQLSFKLWPSDIEIDGVDVFLHGEPIRNYSYLLDQHPDPNIHLAHVDYLGRLANRLFLTMVVYGQQIRRGRFRGDDVTTAKNNFRTLQKFVAHLTAHPSVNLNYH